MAELLLNLLPDKLKQIYVILYNCIEQLFCKLGVKS